MCRGEMREKMAMNIKDKVHALEEENAMLRWNAAHPVSAGQHPVRFWTGVREGEGRTGMAYTPAYIIGGSAGVYIRQLAPGCTVEPAGLRVSWTDRNIGFVCLSHVEVITQEELSESDGVFQTSQRVDG